MSPEYNKFISTYRTELAESLVARPQDYTWTMDEFDQVFARLEQAIAYGTFSKDSDAIKRTCKKLGIKHTYKAIAFYCTGYRF